MPNQKTVKIELLRPNPWNSNHVSPENAAKLQESIRQFGLFKPIVVREMPPTDHDGFHYQILGGEHRWIEAKAAGLTEVPIFIVEADDALAKRITLADNARYGQDDGIELAKLLEEIGSAEDIQSFLPFTDDDVRSIFSTVNIALDELDLPEGFEEDERKVEEPKPERAVKTHTIMRFKVSLEDAERVTELIGKVKKRQGFTTSDDLTNAGDALVHQLFSAGVADLSALSANMGPAIAGKISLNGDDFSFGDDEA